MSDEIERRLMELEIRSEERKADIARLEESVDTYEKRVAALELVIKRMQEDKDNTTEALPPALEDLPPHY
ncbi:MAG: hypothetical protein GY898_03170 [Proteobacteria bacterium]|nr:hypothetical protein [Pseudomonadota bacterium]